MNTATVSTVVTVTTGPISTTNSSVTASPTNVVADGVAITTVTVIGKDATSNPLVGTPVTVTVSGGGNVFVSANTGVLDSTGTFTTTVASTWRRRRP